VVADPFRSKQKPSKTKVMIRENIAATAELNGSSEAPSAKENLTINPQIQQSNNPSSPPDTRPSPRVNGQLLLDELEDVLKQFIVLPEWAPETLALWVLHTYAFELRDVSTYLGIESPEKRCGKTTLLGVLSKVVNRPVAAANISSSAFFRVIEEMRPTLLIDEADTFLRNNDELRGILNAGYTRDTAYVIRTQANERVTRNADSGSNAEIPVSSPCNSFNLRNPFNAFSCWCPKVLAAIGRLPETLADRCIVIRMQRKIIRERCGRLRTLETNNLRQRCARFVSENQNAIATAQPEFPLSLHDRAVDIWEPLFALADLAGGEWPAKGRRAAEGLTTNAQDRNPLGALLFDILCAFSILDCERIFSHDLVRWLSDLTDRPWLDLPGLRLADGGTHKEVTELWLAQRLRPYGIRPRTIRIGEATAKGYVQQEMMETFRRYIPKSELDAAKAELARQEAEKNQPPHKPQSAASNRK
jgi:hypothetical protein